MNNRKYLAVSAFVLRMLFTTYLIQLGTNLILMRCSEEEINIVLIDHIRIHFGSKFFKFRFSEIPNGSQITAENIEGIVTVRRPFPHAWKINGEMSIAPRFSSGYKRGYDQLLIFIFKMNQKYADVCRRYDPKERVKGEEKIRYLYRPFERRSGPSPEKMDCFISQIQAFNMKKNIKVVHIDANNTLILQEPKVTKTEEKKKKKENARPLKRSKTKIPKVSLDGAVPKKFSSSIASSFTDGQISNESLISFEKRFEFNNLPEFEKNVAPLANLTKEDLEIISETMEIENDIWQEEQKRGKEQKQDGLVSNSSDPMLLPSCEINSIIDNLLGLSTETATVTQQQNECSADELNANDLFNLIDLVNSP